MQIIRRGAWSILILTFAALPLAIFAQQVIDTVAPVRTRPRLLVGQSPYEQDLRIQLQQRHGYSNRWSDRLHNRPSRRDPPQSLRRSIH